MSLVWAFAASRSECRWLKRLMTTIESGPGGSDDAISGRVGPNNITLVRTGMGPQKARASAALTMGALGARASSTPIRSESVPTGDQIARSETAAVLVFGLTGSLSHSIAEGDILLYERCLAEDGQAPVMCSQPLTRKLAQILGHRNVSCREVTGISVRRVASTRQEKQRLAQLDAEAVDMESYEVVAEANRRGIPAVVLRAVSDSFERDMPDFNRALNSQGEFDALSLARVCAAKPLASAALAATSWRAMRGIRKALDIILSQPFPDERIT